MMRRLLLLLPLTLGFAANPAKDSADVITGLAAALAADNAQEFMAPFDRKMENFEELRAKVTALLLQADVQSYLDITSNEGNDSERRVEVSWTMRIQRTGDPTPLPDREAHVTCRLEKQGKSWRITAFDGMALFAPAP